MIGLAAATRQALAPRVPPRSLQLNEPLGKSIAPHCQCHNSFFPVRETARFLAQVREIGTPGGPAPIDATDAEPSLVRTSRDGDQFHYPWAARRCLKLLASSSGLVEIAIEQASPAEGSEAAPGEQLIDVAEYYGSSDLATASCVRYIQLKHSTLRATTPWTPSELRRTLAGFAERYVHLREQVGPGDLANKLQFWFVSNRPVSTGFKQSVDNAARLTGDSCSNELKKLQDLVSLRQPELAEFCRLLRFDCSQDDYWNQRNILDQELHDYLPGGDTEAALELKELVNRKALSESAENPSITRYDVLRAPTTPVAFVSPSRRWVGVSTRLLSNCLKRCVTAIQGGTNGCGAGCRANKLARPAERTWGSGQAAENVAHVYSPWNPLRPHVCTNVLDRFFTVVYNTYMKWSTVNRRGSHDWRPD